MLAMGPLVRYEIHGLAEMLGVTCLLATLSSAVHAADAQTSEAEAQTSGQPPAARSPWLLLPTFSSNPKLGTSLGAMGAYVTKFDPESQVSIFGLSAQYTDTDSATAAAIARTSFGADHHRISMLAVGGKIKNDYDDYLGTGMPLKSEDNIRAAAGPIPVSVHRGLVRGRTVCGHELPHRRPDSPR